MTLSQVISVFRQKLEHSEASDRRLVLSVGFSQLLTYGSATQSASTSTNHSRLMKPCTSTKVVADRIAAKYSPCARAAASHCETSVNMIRVRITVSRERPEFITAYAMISRQRLVCP